MESELTCLKHFKVRVEKQKLPPNLISEFIFFKGQHIIISKICLLYSTTYAANYDLKNEKDNSRR